MIFQQIEAFSTTGNLSEDVSRFFNRFGHQKTAEHCAAVSTKAKELAEKFDCDSTQAEIAGLLHDISAVIPNEERIAFARSQGVEMLAEEVQCPMIIHQKLSVVIARDIFQVADPEILSAIECHTTLKAQAAPLDKVVFLADKIAWDQDGTPPYMNRIVQALSLSLDAAALAFLNHLWEQRHQLQIIHPWFLAAREDLMRRC